VSIDTNQEAAGDEIMTGSIMIIGYGLLAFAVLIAAYGIIKELSAIANGLLSIAESITKLSHELEQLRYPLWRLTDGSFERTCDS
jgi:hypothetical protein